MKHSASFGFVSVAVISAPLLTNGAISVAASTQIGLGSILNLSSNSGVSTAPSEIYFMSA